MKWMGQGLAVSVMAALLAAAPAGAAPVVSSGGLQARVTERPWRVAFADAAGASVVGEAAGGLTFRSLGVWAHATEAVGGHMEGAAYVATLRTSDPLGRTIGVRVAPAGDGIVEVTATGPAGADAMGEAFDRASGERFLGFGERSDQVVRDGGEVLNHVSEGPYQPSERALITAFVPFAGQEFRPDATYYPVPWLLSTHGYGVLVDENADSRFTLGRPWSVEADGSRLRYRVYAGPRPADVVRRFTADTGRQPPAAAPFYFGPWWQPKGDPQQAIDLLRRAGAPTSVAQTYTHYLPCGSQQGRETAERQTTARFHAAGLAVTTYFNPMLCTNYGPFATAAARGLLAKDALGLPYVYRYTGSTVFLVGQMDFTAPGASAFYGDLLDQAVANGYDGWMEDFGEYTPPDARSADGTAGAAMHNRYPALYHGAAYAYARDRASRPLARFNRSGWTGAAKSSQLVWGGDPSTTFGFDGLASAVRNGLSMGLSGVSLWGSDIGGYFALSLPQTTPDLERRWIEFGFASGLMRTEADGFSLGGGGRRAQIFDPDVLPTWTRYARLRTQLEPYLAAAERTYDATGMPLMRQLALAYPDDPRAVTRDDEYLLGPDLLVAPVLAAGATSRRVYLPPGRWIDFWRSVDLGPDGAPRLHAPTVLDGGREVELPAPADEIPLLVRAGAALPLLPADVQTLTDYGTGIVHLRDRVARRTVLAWPQAGAPPSAAAPADDAIVRSGMHGRRAWALRVQQSRRRRLDLQVALPWRPCRLTVAGRRARFADTHGVLRATVRIKSGTVLATRCR